jgi:hypothetical protein
MTNETLKYVFDSLRDSKQDLARIRKDPPPMKPGQDDSSLLRMMGAAVHSMELSAVQLLQTAKPASYEVQ